uniref:Arginine vasopressin-induced protein 1 n=1 Tax=Kryptolebias marmoratus TaxID=37003 RepID=A0A3Q2ZS57_KRYMA
MGCPSTSHPPLHPSGPSSVRRNRKAGSGNIFSSVNLWQLQRLFRAAGDQDAEQRAQVIWGHRDDAELAQALIGMRTRSQRRGPEPHRHASVRATAEETEAKFSLTESQGPTGLSERPAKSSSGLRRGGDPERYLHRILH